MRLVINYVKHTTYQMRKGICLTMALLIISIISFSQKEVSIGTYRLIPEQNVRKLINSKSGLSSSALSEDTYYVLIQLEKLPTAKERASLQSKGVFLNDYLGGNAYYGVISKGSLSNKLSNSHISSVIPIKPEWKIDALIRDERIPDWADAGDNFIRTNVSFSTFVKEETVKKQFEILGLKVLNISKVFRSAEVLIPSSNLIEVASFPWVNSIRLIDAPVEGFNLNSRSMLKANVLGSSASFGGRELTGKGVKVGVWDGDVESHADFGSRLHVQEFEMSVSESGSHGMHVSGTLAGAGIMDPKAKGIAPGAELYTHNFNVQSNGLVVQQEMFMAREKHLISITQNSYGPSLRALCNYIEKFSYSAQPASFNTDLLSNYFPTLTHIYAAGNSQGECGIKYGSSLKRSKNSIYVGAVDPDMDMTSFSSWGPMDDGRILPTVSAYGTGVYSCVANNKYAYQDGTSMACPSVSGVVALITERYMQLNKGQEPSSSLVRGLLANTAIDKGNQGPDYQYGYGVVDAEAAIRVVENKNFEEGLFIAGENAKQHKITVPNNVSKLKVMLTWTDTVSNKQYAYREAALINDLDLSIEKNSEKYSPWVLNPQAPNKPATKGIDSLNNMEQVTIDQPIAGEYIINVNANKGIFSYSQSYTLVYFYEYEKLRLSYPFGKEIFEPGEKEIIRWEYGQAPFDIQLSLDNGISYKTILSGIKTNSCPLTIPADIAYTDKAFIRIIDKNDFSINKTPFTIMPSPKNLKVEVSDCDINSWKLKWDIVKNISKYEIMKANLEKGIFYKIGEATDTNYTIQAANIANDKRNIYSVRAVSSENISSERSKAIEVEASQPLKIVKLPFIENFVKYPSIYFKKIKEGDNMYTSYEPNVPGKNVIPGSHSVMVRASSSAKEWNDTLPFEKEKNTIQFRICNLDFSTLETNDVILSFKMLQYCDKEASDCAFKLLINDKTMLSVAGDSLFNGLDKKSFEVQTFAFDLSKILKAGEKHLTIDAFFANKTTRDIQVLNEITLSKKDEKIDVELLKINTIADGNNLPKRNKLSIDLANHSLSTILNLPVELIVNDSVVATEIVDKILPQKTIAYTFNHQPDFSTSDPMGKNFNIKVKAILAEDIEPKNNYKTYELANFGEVFTMPLSGWLDMGGGNGRPIDHLVNKTVDKCLVFSDAKGAKKPYPTDQISTLRFYPSSKDKIIKVVFKALDIEKHTAMLEVYNYKVPDHLRVFNLKPTQKLDGRIDKEFKILSKATDGSITFRFLSARASDKIGWIAEVCEISKTNLFTLNPVVFDSYYPNQKAAVKISVKNNAPIKVANIEVAYKVNDGDYIKGIIPKIEAQSEAEYEFKDSIDFTKSEKNKIQVEILSEDIDVSDNVSYHTLVNDIYCKPVIEKNNEIWVQKVGINEKFYASDKNYQNTVDYFKDSLFVLYKDVSEQQLTVELNVFQVDDTPQLNVWIDWNNDHQFSNSEADGEMISINLKSKKYLYKTAIKIPENAKAGNYRMRVAVSSNKFSAACENISSGDIEDYTISLIKNYPISNDVGIDSIGIKYGIDLTTEESIKVYLKNNSAQETEPFEIAYQVGNNEVVKETMQQKIPPFGTESFTFNTKADFSAIGTHFIKTFVTQADQNVKNDTLKSKVYNVKKTSSGLSAIRLKEGVNINEYLRLGTLNGANVDDEALYEAWVNVDYAGIHHVFNGKDIVIFTFDDSPDNFLKNNCIGVLIGTGLLYYSEPDIVKPKQWQHIAVTLKQAFVYPTGMTTQATLYVNGEEVPMQRVGRHVVKNSARKNLYAATRFSGMIDELRIWNNIRTPNEIKENIYKHRFDKANMPTGLIAEFSFDEGIGNTVSLSDKNIAEIVTKRSKDTQDPLWVSPDNLIAETQFLQQTTSSEKTAEQEITVKLKPGTNLAKVSGKILPTWPNAILKYNGALINDSTIYDFSGVGNKINIKASATQIFGIDIPEKNYTIKAEIDLSAACQIEELIVKKSLNSGLQNDIVVSPTIPQTIKLDLTGIDDIGKVKLSFKLSDGAKATYNEQELISETTEIDLTKPTIIYVTAANQRDSKLYIIQIAKKQLITWDFSGSTNFKYGAPSVQLDATTNSGLPINYVSSNNNIATVDTKGKLIFTGIGTANIVATQGGDSQWNEATPINQSITVERKEVSIYPEDISVKFTSPIPNPTIVYEGLVNEKDSLQIPVPEYEIYENGNILWNSKTHYLPVSNKHTYKPKSVAVYDVEKYKVTPKEGKIKVENTTTYDIKFIISDEVNNIKDANLTINNISLISNVNGEVALKLSTGSYDYEISKPNYTTAKATLQVIDKNIEIQETIKLKNILLNYTADANGIIVGKANQKIENKGKGMPVKAVAKFGYKFKQWNDGKTNNPRVDENIENNTTVNAEFEKNKYSLTYSSSEGGKVLGTTTQKVKYGESGTEVIAEADENYFFLKWSDGNKNKKRTDTNIIGEVEHKALFSRNYYLPFSENFDLKENTPDNWENEDTTNNGEGWMFTKTPHEKKLWEGVFALSSFKNVGSKEINNKLTSPQISLDGIEGEISVKFFYMFQKNYGASDKAFVEYKTDKQNWTKLSDITGRLSTFEIQKKEFSETIQVNALNHAKYIKFRWTYHAENAYGMQMDDIQITASVSTKYVLTYLAGEGGTINGKNMSIEVKNKGEQGTSVTAIPNENYEFVKWSDGSTDNPRTDDSGVDVTALFKKKVQTYTLIYQTTEKGSIKGLVWQTNIQKGKNASPVLAIPNEGYKFAKWSDGVSENPRLDKAVSANINVTAEFEALPQIVTILKVENGTISVSPNQKIKTDTEITIQTTPNKGFQLKEKSLKAYKTDDESINVTITDSKFVMPPYGVTVTASFEVGSYVEDVKYKHIKIYPNPFKEQIAISGTKEIKKISVINAFGQLISEQEIFEKNKIIIDTKNLNNGIYLIILHMNNGDYTVRKIVKE